MPDLQGKALQVVDIFANGGFIREACEQVGIGVRTFYEARKRYSNVDQAYARAREMKADLLADQTIEIADGDGDPNDKRLRVDTRKWLAGCFNRTYTPNQIVDIKGTVDLRAAMTGRQAIAFGLPCDSTKLEDSQALDVECVALPAPTDCQSEKASLGSETVDPFAD